MAGKKGRGNIAIQSVLKETSARTSTTSVFPGDDTIPTFAEGDTLDSGALDFSITPKSPNSRIRVTVDVKAGASGGAQTHAIALFKDASGVDEAEKTCVQRYNNNAELKPYSLVFEFKPGSLTEIVFNIRIGIVTTGTMFINDWNAADRFMSTYVSCAKYEELEDE